MVNVEKALSIVNHFNKYASVRSILIKDSSLPYQPEVSICIPTYKRVSTLKDTVESALGQLGFDKFDIIICDNNPERGDDTEQYVMSLNDPHVKYYKHENNIGMFGNMNRLYELSDAEYTLCLHDDDILLPHYLKQAMYLLKKFPEIDALFPRKILWKDDGITPVPSEPAMKEKVRLRRASLADFYMGNPSPPSGEIIKTNSMKTIGGFDYDTYPSNDYYFNIKATLNLKVYFLDFPLFVYRWGVNASLKKETLLGFNAVDVPLQKWISKQGLYYRLFYKLIFLSYSRDRKYLLLKLYPDSKDEEMPYLKTTFSRYDNLYIKLGDKIWYKIEKVRNLLLARYIIFKSY